MGQDSRYIAVFGGALYEELEFNLLHALQLCCEREGYQLCVYSFSIANMRDERLSQEEEHLIRLASYLSYAGIVLMVEAMRENRLLCDRVREIGERQGIPVFAYELPHPGCIDLHYDFRDGFMDMVRHVLVDHGCRNVHMIAGIKGNSFSDERIDAFRAVLEENGISFDSSMVSYGDFWDRPTRDAVEHLLANPPLPGAIICANDTMAVTTCSVLKEAGIRVPEDVIVTGFDGISVSALNTPSISSVGQDVNGCVQFILNRIKEGGPSRTGESYTMGSTQLRRCSCGCMKHNSELSEQMVKEYADSFMDVNWCMRIMNHLTSQATTMEDLNVLAKALIGQLWVWKQYSHYAALYEELLSDEPGAPSKHRFRTFYRYKEEEEITVDEAFSEEDFFPGLQEMLRQERPGSLVFMRLLSTADTSYGFIAEGLSHVTNRDIRRSDEFGMFISTAINTVLNNRRLLQLNRHLQEANTEIAKSAVSDYLTGIYNRRGFFQAIYDAIQASENQGKVMTVFSLDMDGLKMINDHYGHQEGDVAIRGIADAIRHVTSDYGFCARYGGDEFACAIIMDHPVLFTADEIRKQLGEAISQDPNLKDKPYPITASVGSAHGTILPGFSVEEMIRRSDDAMYKDKLMRKKNRK